MSTEELDLISSMSDGFLSWYIYREQYGRAPDSVAEVAEEGRDGPRNAGARSLQTPD